MLLAERYPFAVARQDNDCGFVRDLGGRLRFYYCADHMFALRPVHEGADTQRKEALDAIHSAFGAFLCDLQALLGSRGRHLELVYAPPGTPLAPDTLQLKGDTFIIYDTPRPVAPGIRGHQCAGTAVRVGTRALQPQDGRPDLCLLRGCATVFVRGGAPLTLVPDANADAFCVAVSLAM